MAVTPPGPPTPPPSGKGKTPLASSPKAYQVETKVSLHEAISKISFFKHWFFTPLKWLEAKFIRRQQVKEKYVTKLQTIFLLQAQDSGYKKDEAQKVFEHLKPHLLETKLEDLIHFEKLIIKPDGLICLMNCEEAFNYDSVIQSKALGYLTEFAIQAMKKNPEAVDGIIKAYKAFASKFNFSSYDGYFFLSSFLKLLSHSSSAVIQTADDSLNTKFIRTLFNQNKKPEEFLRGLNSYLTVAQMLKGRLNPQDEHAILQQTLEMSRTPDHLQRIEQFIQQAETIQKTRTQIPLTEKMIAPFSESIGRIAELPNQFSIIKNAVSAIADITIVRNMQPLQENIDLIWNPVLTQTSELTPILYGNPFSLSVEYRAPVDISKGDEKEMIQLDTLSIDLYVTNDKTWETRTLHRPLPFKESVTRERAKAILQCISAKLGHNEQEDFFPYALQEGSKEDRTWLVENSEIIDSWVEETKNEFEQCQLDFNGDSLHKMSFAKEQPATHAVIENPFRNNLALNASKEKDLYRVEGKLSLLPPEAAEYQKELAYIDMGPIKGAFLQNEQTQLSTKVTKGQTAELLLKREATEEGFDIATTFKIGDQTYTRTVHYPVQKEENQQDKLEQLIQSGHLERDILLAKAEFLQFYHEGLIEDVKKLSPEYASQLSALSIEDLNLFKQLLESDRRDLLIQLLSDDVLETPEGMERVLQIIASLHPQQVIDKPFIEELKPIIQGALTIPSHAFLTYPLVASLMKSRLTPAENLQYLVNVQVAYANMETGTLDLPEDMFASTYAFLNMAQEIQNQRPKLPSFEQKNALINLFNQKVIYWPPELKNIFTEICEMTAVRNTQVCYENIAAFYTPPNFNSSSGIRTTPLLTPLADYPFALSTEFHPTFELFKPPPFIIPLEQLSTDLYLTDERTMETRALYLPLPVTHTDSARNYLMSDRAVILLKFLRTVMATPTARFDAELERSGLTEEEKQRYIDKERIINWVEKVQESYAQAYCDFNATEGRPKMAFAKESPPTKAALEDPTNAQKALEAAKERNIYLSEGKLSLLPSELGPLHPEISYLGDLSKPLASLEQRQTATWNFSSSKENQQGQFICKMEIKEMDGVRVIACETVVTGDHKTHVRRTFYALKEGETVETKLKSLTENRLLERDLLLAKAGWYAAEKLF